MSAYTVINGTPNQLANVDGSTDVEAMSFKSAITLSGAQLAALLDGVSFADGEFIAVMFDQTGIAHTTQAKRAVAIASLYASA